MSDTPFWEQKTLAEMSREEWEQLCDGCARCCLIKLEDEEDGSIHYTNIVCRYLDRESCRCGDYAHRTQLVPDCLQLSMNNVDQLHWMPSTCAYRLLIEGHGLPSWHPLVSGDPQSIHGSGISIRSFAVSEDQVSDPDELQDHIMEGLE